MTNQQAFSKMVRHLRAQGKKAMVGNDCRYRFRGLKCAVGCLIPDNQYQKDFEGSPVQHIQNRIPALKNVYFALLMDMQFAHDSIHVGDWEEKFAELARRYNLVLPRKTVKRGT